MQNKSDMGNVIEEVKQKVLYNFFSDLELSLLIPGTENRRYALVKRAMAKGDLIQVRRGLYCLAEKYRGRPLNLFALAQKIYGPSYISLESALSHHGWIPEAVFSITSASAKRSREFKTPLGVFSFTRIPADPFLTAVDLHQADEGSFLMARPWRAIADYVYAYKKDWKGLHPLVENLRVDEEHFQSVDRRELGELEEIAESFRSRRVHKFIKGVLKELS
jgi:hypothetical protein